jgi:uncharacterized protein YjiS (DUF1127 family)
MVDLCLLRNRSAFPGKVDPGFPSGNALKKEVAMSNSHCSSEVSTSSAIAGFAARVVNKTSALFTAWQNRRAVYQLGQMSDHELSDIGLTRADLYAVQGGPLSVDPTARLGALVHGTCKVTPLN